MAKKKKRDATKFPGLNKNLFSKVKQEYHDVDYADKLGETDKAWLSQFMEEYLGAQLHKPTLKNKYNKGPKHRNKKLRKDCYDRNNARQRDIYGLSKATGRLSDYNSEQVNDYLEAMSEEDTASYEDRLIKLIDGED